MMILGLIVLPPIVLFLEAQNLSDLSIAEWRLPFSHLARDRCIRRCLLQELFGRYRCRDRVVRRIEYLKTQTTLLNAQSAYLT